MGTVAVNLAYGQQPQGPVTGVQLADRAAHYDNTYGLIAAGGRGLMATN